ncbi:MAG TPA: hypothetical protein VFM05_06810 [Candidatus Saccharimonadales bacterium]|nr:hypothetical protein [Candidatus Saccharimonadales bacterium]
MYLFLAALVKTTKLARFMLILLSIGCLTLVPAQTRRLNADGQKVTKEELDRRFALARSLAQEKKYELALKEYLFVFDSKVG